MDRQQAFGEFGPSVLNSAPLSRVHNDMETQIHLIEQEAYSSILRAFKAQSDAITWDKRVKELYNRLPTPNELHVLGEEGVRIEVILVDFQKDKKLAMLKQLITTLVSGSNPASVIKKIAGTVSDFYKRPTLESPSKLALEENAISMTELFKIQ